MFGIFRKPLPTWRFSEGGYVDGFWKEGVAESIPLTASVQPASQLDMQLLPEGRRLTGSYRLYTDATLRAAREGTEEQADLVQINGEPYEVMAEMPWGNNIINHNAYLVSRVAHGGAAFYAWQKLITTDDKNLSTQDGEPVKAISLVDPKGWSE